MIITVRSDTGAGVRGSDLGISALLDLAAQSGIADKLTKNNCDVAVAEGYSSECAKHIEKVLHICEALCAEVCLSLKSGHVPIVLSGDHSSAIGTIAGIKKAQPEVRLGIIWVDAHADLHTPYTSHSGNMHGMTLAASLGLDNTACLLRVPEPVTLAFWERFKRLGGPSGKIKPSDIVYVSLRDLEAQEAHLIEKYGIRNISMQELRELPVKTAGGLVLEYLKDCTAIYLSFDTDSLDGAVSKGTGLPVDHGLMPEIAAELIGVILKDPKVVCFEITELNPRLDINHATTNMVYRILEKALTVLTARPK